MKALSDRASARSLNWFKQSRAGLPGRCPGRHPLPYNETTVLVAYREIQMKKLALAAAALAALSFAGAASANPDLAKAKNCMACHAIDKKVVGPAFHDVAAKYKGQKGADATLAAKIIKGGSGAWGAMAMPPNAVSETEALTLAKWVLAQ